MAVKGSGKATKGTSQAETSDKRSSTWWKVALVCGIGVAMAAGLWFRFDAIRQADAVAQLPDLPDLSGQPEVLVTHLRQADQMARSDPTSADAVGALGMAYHADVFYNEAIRCYALATALNPNAWRWWYYTALLMDELGSSEAEAQALQHVVRLNPDLTLAWFRLGETRLKLGQYDRAEEAYRRVISDELRRPHQWINTLKPQSRTFPLSVYASLGVARIAQEQGKLNEAEQTLEKLTRDYPRFGSAHRLLGRVYQASGRVREGMERTARATFYPPYYPPADSLIDALARESCSSSFLLKQMGVAKQSQNGPWAEYLGRRALAMNDEDPGAVAGFGLLLLKMRRPDDALPYVRRYAEVMGDDVGTLVTMGYDLANLGRLEDAARFVGQALTVDPNSADAHNVMSFVLGEQGQFDAAIAHSKAALKISPNNAQAHDNMATFLARQGKLDEALNFLRKTAELWPNSAEAHNNLGIFLSRYDDLAEAQEHLEKALRIRPDFATAHSNLGVALARQGKLVEAKDHLETALRIQPDNPETHNNLSGVLISLGALGAARAHLETALKIQPDYASARQNLAHLMKRMSR